MTAKQCLPITDFVRRAYLAYFKIKLGDQDKLWALRKVCGACVANLRNWSKGQKCRIKFGVPMVWREPKDHFADCYFSIVNIKGLNSKTKYAAIYPDIPSARRPVDHCAEVPIPVFYGLPSLQNEDTGTSQDKDDMTADLDFLVSTSLEPSPFKQEDLSDLVRDLCLSKQQSEVLASRLQQRALLCPDTKIAFYRNREKEFLSYFTCEDDFVYCDDVKGLSIAIGMPKYEPTQWRLSSPASGCPSSPAF